MPPNRMDIIQIKPNDDLPDHVVRYLVGVLYDSDIGEDAVTRAWRLIYTADNPHIAEIYLDGIFNTNNLSIYSAILLSCGVVSFDDIYVFDINNQSVKYIGTRIAEIKQHIVDYAKTQSDIHWKDFEEVLSGFAAIFPACGFDDMCVEYKLQFIK